MVNLDLNSNGFVGKGNERICYVHPEDSAKVIKVQYNDKKKRNQNLIELLYYSFLVKKKTDFSHVAKFFGSVETSQGKGLVFEKVENYDNTRALSLHEVIKYNILSKDEVLELLHELYFNLKKNKIIFADVGFDNIVCKKTEDNKWSLVVIDGLGSRHTGFKLWMSMHSRFYIKYKLRRQFSKILKSCEKIFYVSQN